MVFPPKETRTLGRIPKCSPSLLSKASNELATNTRLGEPKPFQEIKAKIIKKYPLSIVHQ